MFNVRRILGLVLATALVAATGIAIVTAAATSAPNAQPMCPTVGTAGASGCAVVITVANTGTVSIAPGTNTKPIDGNGHGEGDDVVVGVVNDSNAVLKSIALSGPGRDEMFGFDGDGICTWTFSGTPSFTNGGYCATNGPSNGPSYATKNGKMVIGSGGKNPYDYEGPDNTFSGYNTSSPDSADSGTVNFTTPLPPQGTTFLSLETAPTGTALTSAVATLTTGLVVATPGLSGTVTEGTAFSGQVTTFTDTGSIAPPSEFNATVRWGDGTTGSTTDGSSPPDVTVSAGTTAGSYVVSGTHTYAEYGSYPVSPATFTVTVTDAELALNTASSMPGGTVTVLDAPLTNAQPVAPFPPQTTGVTPAAPGLEVATFQDENPDSATNGSDFIANTTINWGDGTTVPDITPANAITGSTPVAGRETFTVYGTHAYAVHGTYTVTVSIADDGGMTAGPVTDTVLVADSVTPCPPGTGCTGSLNSNGVGANVVVPPGNTGDLLLSGTPTTTGQLNCGDTFLHAPTILSTTNTFLNGGTGEVVSTESFPVSSGVQVNSGSAYGNPQAFWVCFQSPVAFNDISGSTAAFSQGLYTGLLPLCDPLPGAPLSATDGPCVNSITIAPVAGVPTVTEEVTHPVADDSANDGKYM
jgi:hypothetical protein